MSSNPTLGVETRERKRKRERRDALNAGQAIPGLLNDIVVTHVLKSEHFDEPADLARLPAVSLAMRDAVAATGLTFEEFDENDAGELGCLSAVQRLQRGGRLSRQELLCYAAARSGHLEKLQAFRADGCPWDEWTCKHAARGGHLDVLQWARAIRLPVGREYVLGCGAGRAPRGAAVGARERLPVQQGDVLVCGIRRAPRGAPVGTRERLPVERVDVRDGGEGRAPRVAAVGARERMSVEPEHAQICKRLRNGVGGGERRTRIAL